MKDLLKIFKSFRFAFEGIKYALSTQHNMRFHFFTSVVVLLAALVLHLSKTDVLFLFLAITLVIITELTNTAVEKAVDLAMPEMHPFAKIAKDTAAAAVLVSAVFAAVVGIVVFFRSIDTWISDAGRHMKNEVSEQGILIFLVLIVMVTILLQINWLKKSGLRPSLSTAVTFCASTLISIIAVERIVHLLAYVVAVLMMIVQFDKKQGSAASVLSGALVGIVFAILLYYFTFN